jgi:hypothetical protein
MKYLKNYLNFKESIQIDTSMYDLNIQESLSIWQDSLLNSINAEKLDFYDELKLERTLKLDLDYLANNNEFINSLSSLGLKRTDVQNTDDYETLLNKSCKFMPIYRIEANELENPVYIAIQFWTDSLSRWEDANLYRVKEDMKKFYDKLTSKTIEITEGDNKFIYRTSNGGNDWVMQSGDETEDFKKSLRKEELQQLVSDKNIKINII